MTWGRLRPGSRRCSSKKAGHDTAIRAARYLLASESFAVVETQDTARTRAIDLLQAQPQSVSFTDCVVMAVADEYGTKRIFGFDEAFRKNGYHILTDSPESWAA